MKFSREISVEKGFYPNQILVGLFEMGALSIEGITDPEIIRQRLNAQKQAKQAILDRPTVCKAGPRTPRIDRGYRKVKEDDYNKSEMVHGCIVIGRSYRGLIDAPMPTDEERKRAFRIKAIRDREYGPSLLRDGSIHPGLLADYGNLERKSRGW